MLEASILLFAALAAVVLFIVLGVFKKDRSSSASSGGGSSPSGPSIPSIPSSLSLAINGVPVQSINSGGVPGYPLSPGPSATGVVFTASLGPLNPEALPLPSGLQGVQSGVTLTDPQWGNLVAAQIPNSSNPTFFLMPLSIIPGVPSRAAQFIPITSLSGGSHFYEVMSGQYISSAVMNPASSTVSSLALSSTPATVDVVG